ncbi:gamma-glutamylcyclotransferase [Bradyrhizobium sp. LA6.10]|uniref:gamma-glutamylcyclotransferase n=1 Tax=Bradyrhizobium sp. LA6.10 TaxID=3156318 RepID=UPI003390A863
MVWVFGFGSLTFDGWQAEFGCLSHQRATLHGYRRAFNKKSVVNWGSEENPGITLNLRSAPGDKCGIRGKAATDSDGRRPPIPIESGHPIRTKAATLLIG